MPNSPSDALKMFELNQLIGELRGRATRKAAATTEAVTEAAPTAAPVDGATSDLAAFASEVIADFVSEQQKLIYGVDDRKDFFEVTNSQMKAGGDSVVSLFRASDVTDNGDGTSTLRTEQLGMRLRLCSSERFRNQPTGAFCSGFVVGKNLIATAGHCATTSDVTTIRFVFGFRMDSATVARVIIPNSEIYAGVAIVARKLEAVGSDFAIVRVDRNISGHPVVNLRRSGKIADGASVHVIGHPSGLPVKFAGGAVVRDNTPTTFFIANLDTYGGNSGSPVFNSASHEVEGILVRGGTDYVPRGTCNISLVCPSSGCGGEDCTRASEFTPYVPPTS